MKITEVCIKRPVLSTVLSLVIMLLGLVAFQQLQVRQYPKLEQPQISIQTQLEGASPQIMESQVTKILEDALSGIEGLYLMQSRSEQGDSRITLTFDVSRNIDAAANDVRDKIGRVRNKLPQEAQESRIKKADADAQAIIYLTLSSDRHSIEELADYAYRFLESQLEILPGVAQVDIWGGGEYEMKIALDPIKMNSYKITSEEIAQAIKRQNIEKPAGSIITRSSDIVLTTRAPLITETDFNNVIVSSREGALVRLQDIGSATLSTVDTKSRVRFNDKPAVGIGLTKQSVANPLSIAQKLYQELPRFQSSLLQGMKLDIANDQTIFIKKYIDRLYQTLAEATILVFLVILVFLRSPRAVLIPLVTIPVSLIGTLFIMLLLGFSLNILTLLALIMAIGLVVDDAIVMLENIYRHIEEGMQPVQAAFLGAKEISLAVISMTVTLGAVYAPIALIPGFTGRIFTEFAITLAGAVLISGFVALTLTPTMCGRFLKAHNNKNDQYLEDVPPVGWKSTMQGWLSRLDQKIEKIFNSIDDRYERSLKYCLTSSFPLSKKRYDNNQPTRMISSISIICGLGIAIIAAGGFIYDTLKTEFFPLEDQGILRLRGVPPFGANIDFVDRYMKKTEALLKGMPEVEKRLTIVSVPGESFSLNLLKPWSERSRTTAEVADQLNEELQELPGINASAYSSGSRLGAGKLEAPFELTIQTTANYQELGRKAEIALKAVGTVPGLIRPETEDFSKGGQEYEVTINRNNAALLGVEIDTIANTLDTLIGGKPISKFKRENKLFSVKIQLSENSKAGLEDIGQVYVRGIKDRKEASIPLSELITIQRKMTPIEISHIGGFRAATISARLEKGQDLLQALERAQKVVQEAIGDSKTKVEFGGESRRFIEENKNIYMIFGLAIAFIFLVLAAQYESWRDPIIIILSVPLSLVGGVIFLKIFGQSLNTFSKIGLVTLIGLITKHGILIVDFANKLKSDGYSKADAVIRAARLRLRPILMTTFAMVFGVLPLAIASGAGHESLQSIGITIVGGMTWGTLFTLYVLPAVYTLMSATRAAGDIHGFTFDEHNA